MSSLSVVVRMDLMMQRVGHLLVAVKIHNMLDLVSTTFICSEKPHMDVKLYKVKSIWICFSFIYLVVYTVFPFLKLLVFI